ncbi:hypothetical protein HJ526_17865 [Donghicola sp. C2-DW-16]|uniref:Uncharacterized protein n=1 Tax=Donghicola mangrovi TaxID=2729614 RepID=A0ABX2PIF7_9RHOB|nr:hypothetical protein [Donghicola mangrovi]NVO29291.1 hypothetical protein [Donghicola mangrovi]
MSSGADFLMAAGILIFLVAGLLSLVFFTITGITDTPLPDWARIKSMEVFSMVASVGVVVAIVAKADHAFVKVFGILLIGALIVPTKDMVALAQLASGQKARMEMEEHRYNDGAEFEARISDLSNKIVTKLQESSSKPGDDNAARILNNIDPVVRAQAVLAVADAISTDRKVTHLERARLGGYLPLLMSFGTPDGFREYYFRHNSDPDFLEDLMTLRRHELVSFSYSDFSSADVTYLGKQLICEYTKNQYPNRDKYKFGYEERDVCPFPEVVQAELKDTRLLAGKDASPAQNLEKFCEHAFDQFSDTLPLKPDSVGAKMRLPAPNGWKISRESLGALGGTLTVTSSGSDAENLELVIMSKVPPGKPAFGKGKDTTCTLKVAGSPRKTADTPEAEGQTLSFVIDEADLNAADPSEDLYLIIGDPHLSLEEEGAFSRTFLVDLAFKFEPKVDTMTAGETDAAAAQIEDGSTSEANAAAAN